MNHVLDGGAGPQEEGQFSGVVRTIQKHWRSPLEKGSFSRQ